MTDYANIGPPVAGGDPNDPTAEDTTLYSPIKEPISEDQAVGGGSFVNSWNLRTGNVVPLEGDYVLDQMGDVDLTGLVDGQGIIFNAISGNWEPAFTLSPPVTSVFGRTGAVIAVDGDYTVDLLGDAEIVSPADGEVLTFELSSGLWKNKVAASGVSSVFGRTGVVVAQSGDYIATQITFTPVGGISAVEVQSAIAELDTEKLGVAHEGAGGAVHPAATGSVNGFMSAADKTKLDGITAGAEPNTVDSVFGRTGVVVAAEGDYSLDLLSDVAITAPSVEDFLIREAGGWVNKPASAVSIVNAPSGNVAATDVQAAINELDTEKPQISAEDELVGQMQLAVVAALPGTPNANTIYFVT